MIFAFEKKMSAKSGKRETTIREKDIGLKIAFVAFPSILFYFPFPFFDFFKKKEN